MLTNFFFFLVCYYPMVWTVMFLSDKSKKTIGHHHVLHFRLIWSHLYVLALVFV